MPSGYIWPKKQRELAIHLIMDGLSYMEVARRTKIPVRSLRSIATEARRQGNPIPDRRVRDERKVPKYLYIANETIFAFEFEAERRGVEPSKLIAKLLRTIAREPTLIDAILDGD